MNFFLCFIYLKKGGLIQPIRDKGKKHPIRSKVRLYFKIINKMKELEII